jgi:hypothetical protein
MPNILKPILTATPGTPPTHNFGICETFSYIPIEGAGRPLYARASYITNFSDMSIHLSAGELSIGAVTIKDNNTGLNCDVVSDPDNSLNALRVITQDLESVYDDIAIGDKNGTYYATIDGPLSSLNVKVTNLSTIETHLENQNTLLGLLTTLNLKEFNETQSLLLSSFLITNINLSSIQFDINRDFNETQTLLDSLTSLQEIKQNQIVNLLEQLSSNTDQLEFLFTKSNTSLDALSSLIEFNHQDLLSSLSTYTYLVTSNLDFQISLQNALTSQNTETQNLLKELTSSNLNITTFLDTITAQEQRQISLQTILSSNSVYGTVSSHPLYVEGLSFAPISVSLNDSPNLDAFGRLRVSEPHTLLDTKHLYDKLPLIFLEKLSGTATSQFMPGDSLVKMETFNVGDYAIRQTRFHFNYQTGKSTQALFTGLFKPEPNIIKRVGLFQSLSSSPSVPSDGIFLEVLESGPKICLVKSEGITNSMSIPQSSWNVDPLDGSGQSGVVIDFNKSQIFTIDYEWLGVGRIRFGFVQSGKTYYCHYINNANSLEEVYMTSPNQPIRYQINQIGPGSGKMYHICSTIMTEGGEEFLGKPIAITDGIITGIDTTNYKTLLALKLNSFAYNSSVVLKSIEVLNIGQNAGIFDVLINPTIISGSLVWSKVNDTPLQYSTGGATVSGGYSVFKALVPAGLGGSSTSQNLAIPGEITKLGVSIEQIPDIVVVAAKSFQNSTTMIALANLLERS